MPTATLFAGGMLVGVGLFGLAGTQAQAGTHVTPFYSAVQSEVEMVDMSQLTVAQIVDKLPVTSRFSLLLYNAHVDISGDRFLTVFAPANNYFDYLPRRSLSALNYLEREELAFNHIVPDEVLDVTQALSPDFIIIKAYKAKNGVVYLINKVLVPDDLKQNLE